MVEATKRTPRPRMSTNAPPAVFVVGMLMLPVAFLAAVLFLPSPLGVPVGIGAAIVVGITTNRLTATQVRREAERVRAVGDGKGMS